MTTTTSPQIIATRIVHAPLAHKPWNVELLMTDGVWEYAGCFATRAAAERCWRGAAAGQVSTAERAAVAQPGDRCSQMRANHVVRQVRVLEVEGDLCYVVALNGPIRGTEYYVKADLLVVIR